LTNTCNVNGKIQESQIEKQSTNKTIIKKKATIKHTKKDSIKEEVNKRGGRKGRKGDRIECSVI